MPAYQYQQGDRPLDGYTIQYALGRGGFGEVYFAVSDAGREVALKVVQNFEDIELRGIRHCMNLKSPHLVTIFDVRFAADNTPWVIMEYVAGPSLREIIDESPAGLGVQRTTFLFRELSKGISYLHDAGVVHRDLKPHNVFFEDGTVKIGDYSLSKAITTSHRSGHTMTVGSVHYMAPEISMGRYDNTVDIYALGVILFEMLCGVPPYIGESMGEVLMKHLSSTPDLSEVPEPIASTIAKAMRRDPAERFQTAQAMAESLCSERALSEQVQSFNPLTLSMVGTRNRQLLDNREFRESRPLAETFTSPAMMRDTKEATTADAVDAPSERISLIQQFGLWYSPSENKDRNPDRLSSPVRIAIAVIVSTLLSLYGSVSADSTALKFANEKIFFLFLVHFSFSLVACIGMLGLVHLTPGTWVWCGIAIPKSNRQRFNRRVVYGLATRAILVASAYMVLLYIRSNSPGDQERNFLGVVGGVLFSLLVIDWRCFSASHRHHRVLLRPTIAVGLIALLASIKVLGETDYEIMAITFTMSLALGLQLVAPLRRAKLIAHQDNSVLPNHHVDVSQLPQGQAEKIQEIVR